MRKLWEVWSFSLWKGRKLEKNQCRSLVKFYFFRALFSTILPTYLSSTPLCLAAVSSREWKEEVYEGAPVTVGRRVSSEVVWIFPQLSKQRRWKKFPEYLRGNFQTVFESRGNLPRLSSQFTLRTSPLLRLYFSMSSSLWNFLNTSHFYLFTPDILFSYSFVVIQVVIHLFFSISSSKCFLLFLLIYLSQICFPPQFRCEFEKDGEFIFLFFFLSLSPSSDSVLFYNFQMLFCATWRTRFDRGKGLLEKDGREP